jgi:hypothetical protein
MPQQNLGTFSIIIITSLGGYKRQNKSNHKHSVLNPYPIPEPTPPTPPVESDSLLLFNIFLLLSQKAKLNRDSFALFALQALCYLINIYYKNNTVGDIPNSFPLLSWNDFEKKNKLIPTSFKVEVNNTGGRDLITPYSAFTSCADTYRRSFPTRSLDSSHRGTNSVSGYIYIIPTCYSYDRCIYYIYHDDSSGTIYLVHAMNEIKKLRHELEFIARLSVNYHTRAEFFYSGIANLASYLAIVLSASTLVALSDLFSPTFDLKQVGGHFL